MDVTEKLRLKREAVEAALDQFLPPEDNRLAEAMRYAVFSGGKRYRPLLALSSGECFGVNQKDALPFACALELIHNYSLIHDDLPLMDDDDFRRSKPSCHRAFGEEVALLAGDSLLTLAFEVLASTPWKLSMLNRKERMIAEIARSAGIRGMAGGQLLDISLTLDQLTEESLRDLMAKKTGALILASVKVGPILAGASPSDLQKMIRYGENIGLAFQMRDDILDSKEFSSQDPHRHPNAASYLGMNEARERLKQHVEAALEVLDSASLASEELRYLASRLLKLAIENE
jgi:geranylgeranyl diphosphate synthase type II